LKWSSLLRSPAYRLGVRHGWKATVSRWIWFLIIGGLWFFSTYQFVYASLRKDAFLSLVEPIIWYSCHLLIILFLALTACLAGARSFAPERDGGTMDQLASLPLSNIEVVVGRSLAGLTPLLPTLILVSLGTPVVLHATVLAFDSVDINPPLSLGWLACAGVASTTLLAFSLGFYASLRTFVTYKARLLALLLLLAAFLIDVGIVVLCHAWFSLGADGLVVVCAWHFGLAAAIQVYCISRFDTLALKDNR
jgi:ABC-type transport system involved in multi-copper enzyme maturation permease subunit